MKPAPTPENDAARVAALAGYDVLDSEPEAAFDALAELAAAAVGTPMALISLVDGERQWFKAHYGTEMTETAREISFCGHVVAESAPVIVPDASADARFSDNPLVTGEPRLRFYAGYPLMAPSGHCLGALCAVDRRPREISRSQARQLELLASQAVDQLELRRVNRLLEVCLHSGETRVESGEARLRAVMDSVKDAIITIDAAGTVETVNASLRDVFGYEPEEVIGQNVKMLTPSPHRENHDGYLQRYIQTGERRVIGRVREVEAVRKDGSMFPMELTVTEMWIEGRRMFTGVVRDISERRRVQKMQSEFVSTVSHELRTPLTSIRGSLGLVLGGMTGEVPADARDMLEIAKNNTDRLVRLINDILDIEKMESGRMEFRLAPCEFADIVRRSIAANDAFAETRGTRLVVVGDLAPGEVLVDEDRVTQVLTNLISNAAKFSPSDQPVEVSLERVGARLRVSVRDHGPGIPAEFHSRIFGRFAQSDSSDTRQKGGTGLGLSISKAIVERLKGAIGFGDAPGGGTIFHFEFPSIPDSATAAAGEQTSSGTVLICEDDPDTARWILETIRACGLNADVAPTLARARELMSRRRYTGVTLDLTLADGDGSGLLADLWPARADAQPIPVVIVSGRGEEARERLGRGAVAVVDVLTKPVSEERLRASVAYAIGGRLEGEAVRVLHVEDDPDVTVVVRRLVSAHGVMTTVTTLAAARRALAEASFDLILLDLALPDGSGESLLPDVKGSPVVIFSAAEVSREIAGRVHASLVKSQATNEQVRQVLQSVFRGGRRSEGAEWAQS